jgi:hypothetical protein
MKEGTMREWSVPVFIDTVKNFDDVLMLRCTYFFIDIDEATVAPIAEPQDLDRPAFLMGGREIIMAPSHEDSIFSSSKVIREFFKDVEKEEYQSIEVGVLWIPMTQHPKDVSEKEIAELRGQVLRLPQELYIKCYMYTLDRISLEELLEHLVNLNVLDFRSPDETEAFSDWMEEQIDISKKRVDDLKEINYRFRKSESSDLEQKKGGKL